MKFTPEEMIVEVKREVALRKHLYPRWVSEAKMTQHSADRYLGLMQAVLAELEKLPKAQASLL